MRRRHVESWSAQWTCIGGTCAPAAAPPRNGLERLLDFYTSVTGPLLSGCLVFVTVAAAWALSRALGSAAGQAVEGTFFIVFATYCLANFARCREAHCVVTGFGWSAVGVACVVSLMLGHDTRGAAWDAFLVVAVIGFGFEALWMARHGNNALRLGAKAGP